MITNPIIPGFYPDPSVCRAGDDFYLVASTFEYFPGVPLFHSRDMVNWEQIGHVLSRPSQLPLEGCPRPLGIFAPTIRCLDGRFYMVTTNTSPKAPDTPYGNFYVWTDDIAGEWSDPVWVDVPGIDPDLFLDDDGTAYFTSTGIRQVPIDLETGELLGEIDIISKGSGGRFAEAPHVYKVGGTYYLMLAEGGTEGEHMVTIFRGPSPSGPWEECPHNPIFSHRSRMSPIRATGHADIIEGPEGRWWMVFLGIRASVYPEVHHLGRETFLAPMRWEDGWPVVNDGNVVPLDLDVPGVPDSRPVWTSSRDDFDGEQWAFSWNFLRNPKPEFYDRTTRPGWLGLTCAPISIDQVAAPAWAGQRLRHFNVHTETRLDFDPRHADDEAGMTVYMAETHHYDIMVRRSAGERVLVARRRVGTLAHEEPPVALPPGPVRLFIDADPDWFSLGYIDGKGEPIEMVKGETRLLSKEVAGGFTGVYIALFAQGGAGQEEPSTAWFDFFDYTILD